MIVRPLCFAAAMLGYVHVAIAAEPNGSGATADNLAPAHAASPEVEDIETLRAVAGVPLSPDQALDKQHIGKRIRWAGAIHHMARSDDGVCLTILYALSGNYGEPRWTLDPTYQTFEACTAGTYDPDLVHDLTNVTIVGKISGATYIGMGGGGSEGPAVAIEKLYRWSDCLAGDVSPVCKTGFLNPAPLAGEDATAAD